MDTGPAHRAPGQAVQALVERGVLALPVGLLAAPGELGEAQHGRHLTRDRRRRPGRAGRVRRGRARRWRARERLQEDALPRSDGVARARVNHDPQRPHASRPLAQGRAEAVGRAEGCAEALEQAQPRTNNKLSHVEPRAEPRETAAPKRAVPRRLSARACRAVPSRAVPCHECMRGTAE